jgi:hypothetical protein
MLGNLIGGFIAIVVGAAVTPSIANTVVGATNRTNVTGAAVTITELTTLFWSMAVMSTGVAVAAQGLKAAGILNT